MQQAHVVQRVNSAIPLVNSVGFATVCPLDSDISGEQSYPPLEQMRPDWSNQKRALPRESVGYISLPCHESVFYPLSSKPPLVPILLQRNLLIRYNVNVLK